MKLLAFVSKNLPNDLLVVTSVTGLVCSALYFIFDQPFYRFPIFWFSFINFIFCMSIHFHSSGKVFSENHRILFLSAHSE